MQKIVPNLWCKTNAKEMVDFYTSVFPSSKVLSRALYPTEGLADFQKSFAGKEVTIEFDLGGLHFTAINAGSEFTPTAANSFMVNFDPSRDKDAKAQLDAMWEKLIEGGEPLMPLQKYDFSEHYGWVKDKYGYSWQLILTDPAGEARPFIIPSLMFGDGVQNKAAEAIDFYTSVFNDSQKAASYPYGQPTGPATAEALMFADFTLENQWFTACDSGVEQDFTFNEAVSYAILCKDQAEIDYYWEKLIADGGEESVCGWCKDKFGVSWQVFPANIDEVMKKPRAWQTLMAQKKIIIADY